MLNRFNLFNCTLNIFLTSIYFLLLTFGLFQKNHNVKLQNSLDTERKGFDEKLKREIGALKEQLQVRLDDCVHFLLQNIHQYTGVDPCREFAIALLLHSSTCLQRTLLYPSKSVPTWQMSRHRRDRHVGVEGSVLHIYDRHVRMTDVVN